MDTNVMTLQQLATTVRSELKYAGLLSLDGITVEVIKKYPGIRISVLMKDNFGQDFVLAYLQICANIMGDVVGTPNVQTCDEMCPLPVAKKRAYAVLALSEVFETGANRQREFDEFLGKFDRNAVWIDLLSDLESGNIRA